MHSNHTTHKTGSSRVYISRRQLLQLRYEKQEKTNPRSGKTRSIMAGNILSALKGHGIEFSDIRPYQAGDEVRHIDWHTTARTGIPYIREYSEEKEQTVFIAVDQRTTMFFGSGDEFKSYTAARLAGLIAWASFHQGYRLGGSVIGVYPETDQSPNNTNALANGTGYSLNDGTSQNTVNGSNTYNDHINSNQINGDHANTEQIRSVRSGPCRKTTPQFLSNIAEANNALSADNPTGTAGLGELLRQTLIHSKPGANVFLISDFQGLNANSIATLRTLGRKCRIFMIMVSDKLEEEMPVAGTIGITDGTARRKIYLSQKHCSQYQRCRTEFIQDIQQCAESIDAVFIKKISTSQAIPQNT